MLTVIEREGGLRLPQPEDQRLRPHRPRRRRPRGAGRRRRLRLCRARRLPLQRDRLSHRAAARRAGQCHDRRAADAGDRAARWRRIPPRRAGRPGRGRPHACRLPLNSAVPTGTWRVRAFTDPKGTSVGETTFMVEDYIPERIEFDLSAKDKLIKAEAPVELKVDGHFLYGAPASGPAARRRHAGGAGGLRAAGLSRLPVRRRRRGDRQQRAHADREPAGGRRQWRRDLPGERWRSRRPRRGRRRRRSSSAWRKPAAARSSASWCCRWRPRPP